jgi:F-type H+-transporting ATPase subunit delta
MDLTADSGRLGGYASALMDVARAGGDVDVFVDEFYSAATSIARNAELRDALTDQRIPVARKQGIVTDALGVRVDSVVVAAINFVVAIGEAKHLEDLASRLANLAAEHEGMVVAEVQSAVALDAGQVARLEAALSKATGKTVQAKVVTDPSLIGGVVAKIGDTIFDGSVKGRFEDVREQWG